MTARATLPTRLYLAGPMRGVPFFNFPAFHAAARVLRDRGYEVFSPAERDERIHGPDFSLQNSAGDNAQAEAQGFNLREALNDGLTWICREADGIVLLPGWLYSSGASAELAVALALGLKVFLFDEIVSEGGA